VLDPHELVRVDLEFSADGRCNVLHCIRNAHARVVFDLSGNHHNSAICDRACFDPAKAGPSVQVLESKAGDPNVRLDHVILLLKCAQRSPAMRDA
jgi:hypothetical protein